MWNKYRLFLALLLVVTGSINTLSTKWADTLESVGSDGNIRKFNHPFLQASFMFLGEILCLLTYKILIFAVKDDVSPISQVGKLIRGNRNFNPFIFLPPAMFDLIGTSTMYIGLNLTYPSSFQMFRGSIIIFTALLSITFLNKKIGGREWSGIVHVIIGLLIVGASDFLFKDPNQAFGHNSIITGDLLIVVAQIISASQMVYEEKFVSGLDIAPLQAVGWEGVFGFTMLFFLHIIFYFIPAPSPFNNNARHTVEDAIDGLVQISNNGFLVVSIMGTITSIAFFNFAGISVTKEMSATTRMVLDSVRTIVVWSASLGIGWQMFHWPQLLGFLVLLIGMCLYNNVLVDKLPCFRRQQEMEEPIINHDAVDPSNDEAEP